MNKIYTPELEVGKAYMGICTDTHVKFIGEVVSKNEEKISFRPIKNGELNHNVTQTLHRNVWRDYEFTPYDKEYKK